MRKHLYIRTVEEFEFIAIYKEDDKIDYYYSITEGGIMHDENPGWDTYSFSMNFIADNSYFYAEHTLLSEEEAFLYIL
jgi:hypothetical protein